MKTGTRTSGGADSVLLRFDREGETYGVSSKFQDSSLYVYWFLFCTDSGVTVPILRPHRVGTAKGDIPCPGTEGGCGCVYS